MPRFGADDFDEFYATYEAALRQFAARYVGESDADDLVQEAMLRAARHLAQGGFSGSPWSWLTTVTRNLAVDHYRRSWRIEYTDDTELLETLGGPVADAPSDEAVRADARRRLAHALRRLSPGDRAALLRHEVDGATAGAIAATLGVTAGAVRQRLLRARRSLADHYHQAGGTNLGTLTTGPLVASDGSVPWWTRGAERLARTTRRWVPAPSGGTGRTAAVLVTVAGSVSLVVGPSVPGDRAGSGAPPPPPGTRIPFTDRVPDLPDVAEALGVVPPVRPVVAADRRRAPAGTLTWRRQPVRPAPPARHGAAMAYDPARHETVLFGGSDGATTLGDTWTWNGTAWRRHDAAGGPRARHGAAMTYDAARRETVLFGGVVPGVGRVNETWVWNGGTWTQRFPARAPLPRDRAAVAFDEARGDVVLVGGLTAVGPTDETWIWDGTTWRERNPPARPQPRYGGTLAYDGATRHLVLFGDAGGLGDTWVWTGASWSEAPLAPLPGVPRTEVAMAYDRHNETLLAFGGAYHDDAWWWSGAAWLPVAAPAGPAGRSAATMVFDTHRGEFVLFGGRAATGGPLGDTWTASFRSVPRAAAPAVPADIQAPLSTFETADLSVVGPADAVRGAVGDAGSAVVAVDVRYEYVTYELSLELPVVVRATLDCDPAGRSCAWTAPGPVDPGVYTVSVWSTDAAGNRSQSADRIRIVRVAADPPGLSRT